MLADGAIGAVDSSPAWRTIKGIRQIQRTDCRRFQLFLVLKPAVLD
jgi:hypothetical protein